MTNQRRNKRASKRAWRKWNANTWSRPTNRRNATRVLATGVGATVPRAFGGKTGSTLQCWDAKHPSHLPLPRAVGPYTTIRATKRVQINSVANIIGSYQDYVQGSYRAAWSEAIMVTSDTSSDPINGPTNAFVHCVDLGGLGSAATLVPSALSVQIMCPTALQTATGIVYAGVMNTQADIAGRTEVWDTYMEKFVQFQNPRLLAASKLALRGVQINSYPLNMSEVANFTPLRRDGDGAFSWTSEDFRPVGWAPIVIFNPSEAALELLITIEYRVRFDLDHPASASHKHHPVATDSTWDRLSRGAAALGNGVLDIADVVANTGNFAQRVMGGRGAMAALTV
jgi:hypothetical protein